MKQVEIVIPVYYANIEELEDSVDKQIDFYKKNLKGYDWKIIIGLNGPDKEGILNKIIEICKNYDRISYDHISEPGRGASLNHIFLNSKADYVCYMDVDLATSLDAVPRMLEAFDQGYEVVVGSKYLRESHHERIPLRLLLSRTYNSLFTKLILNAQFTDAQCGFKGMRTETAKKLIPLIKDPGWFWDTEMLYMTQKKDYRFKEVKVSWVERGDSGVKLFKTTKEFIAKTIRLRYRNL